MKRRARSSCLGGSIAGGKSEGMRRGYMGRQKGRRMVRLG